MASHLLLFSFALVVCNPLAHAAEITEAKEQHGVIGISDEPVGKPCPHTDHADAKWFPQAGFGFFLHWGLSSVLKDQGKPGIHDISWPMMIGGWSAKTITDPAEQARILKEGDWTFDGKPMKITPNQYWSAINDFNPGKYDADKWIAAAKKAGFTYAVLTTSHHEGFAMWPSDYGDFSTKNHMGGRDLV
ncbi:MAG TPA: alpha-L-fucosidase, partial [Luteolibacter sp.]